MLKSVDFQIIANLMAGKKETDHILESLKRFLDKNNKSYDVLAIDHPMPISKLPKGDIKVKEAVVCLGGDGTVSETVDFMLNNKLDLPLAIIPTGTANFIAKAFDIADHNMDFDFLLQKNIKKIDIGQVEYGETKDYFLLGFGLGFEEKFLKLTKDRFKNKLGIFSYILAAFAELLSLRKIPIKIETLSQQIKMYVCALLVLNVPTKILNLFPLFKFSSVKEDDGLLSLKYIEYKNYLQALLGTLFLHILGRVNFGQVKTVVGKNFYIESSELVSTQIDGELKGNLPMKISILPSSFTFLV